MLTKPNSPTSICHPMLIDIGCWFTSIPNTAGSASLIKLITMAE